jgi:hypothetical protein
MSRINRMHGLLAYWIDQCASVDEKGNEIEVDVLYVVHEDDAFEDKIYQQLCYLVPDNSEEISEDGSHWVTKFNIPVNNCTDLIII